MVYLKTNNIKQKTLAEQLAFSPQYLSKVLKGKENLTLETIVKLQSETNIQLIQIPGFEVEHKVTMKVESIV